MLKIGRRDKKAREFMTNVFSNNRIGKYNSVGKNPKTHKPIAEAREDSPTLFTSCIRVTLKKDIYKFSKPKVL